MSKPQIKVNFVGHFGDDLQHVNAAKASFGRRSEWGWSCGQCKNNSDDCWLHDDKCGMDGKPIIGKKVLKEKDKRLLQFLARGLTADDFDKFLCDVIAHHEFKDTVDLLWQWRDTPEHRSPFNHTFLSFEVEAPIFVARQLVKHEYMVVNEISGRYIEFSENSIYIPDEFRSKVRDKKQGSGEPLTGVDHDKLTTLFLGNATCAYDDYQEALERGLCEEQARGLLPLNLMTYWRWSGTFGAFAKMLRLRLAPDAQKESRMVAEQIGEIIKPLFPVSYASLVEREF